MRIRLLLTALLLAAPLIGCEAEPDPIHVLVEAQCEGTNPQNCLMPWPSDRWLVEDSSTVTGLRLQYDPAAVPLSENGNPFDVTPYSFRDGFSPASAILTLFGGDVDVDNTAGLAVEGSDELSLLGTSPTILLDLQTGAQVPHWVEVDQRAHEDDAAQFVPDQQLLYLHPSYRLEENRSYAVAIRDVHLVDGTVPGAWPAFEALRDGVITDAPLIEDRRASYEEMFTALETAGVERASLQQAWRFHTASGENIRGDLIAMRDDALERVPVGGGDCTALEVREDYSDETFRRVDGTFEVPLYMDSEYTGSRVVRGADGLPEFQGWTSVPFTILIPHSLAGVDDEPGRLLAFGHGLMGDGSDEGGGSFLRNLGNDYGMVTLATDWQGMSTSDLVTVASALSDVGTFASTGERLMQGMINNVVMIRSFKGNCRTLPELMIDDEPVIDDGEPYWLGISQGGIFGGTLMALTPDVNRGALLVGGMSYPLMIGRSVDFYEYEIVFRVWYPERLDREILMNMMISLWDHAEPNPWLPHLVDGGTPGGTPKQILYQIARDDSQVPNVSSDIAVRTMGLPLLTPSPVEPWGIETTAGPAPSAYVYYDMQREPSPPGNVPPDEGNGSHGAQRWVDAARDQMNAFWQPDGEVIHFCEGPCVFE